jgi:hypothetical protein
LKTFSALLRIPFPRIAAPLSQRRESDDFKGEVTPKGFEAPKRLAALEERMQQRDEEIAALQTEPSL